MEQLYVGSFGAVGGLISWILTNASGAKDQLGIHAIFGSILATMLIGAATAYFAIYYLLPLDMTKRNKVLALALACGVFWQPIMQGMKRTVNGISVGKTSSELAEQKKNLDQPSLDPQKAKDTLSSATELIIHSSDQANSVDDVDHKIQLEQGARDVIAEVPKAAAAAPKETYESLSKVGQVAVNNNQREIANEALSALKEAAPKNCTGPADEKCKSFDASVDQLRTAAQQRSWHDISNRASEIQAVVKNQ